MGLDMFLFGCNYLSKFDNETDKSEEKLTEEIYWRKANQIHNWFVKNVQRGVDNCAMYYVSAETLQKLLNVCKQTVEDPSLAKLILPTQGGFFFGSTDYDEYYEEDVKYTIQELERVLKENKYDWYYYMSSW